MTTAELRFPAGRYHATPWGRHVNEGPVEWPPAPWRVLRALVATWFLKARSDIAENEVRSLIEALSSVAPGFSLPRASLGHTRHYLPYLEGAKAKTTKVFDAFVHIEPPAHALQVHWPIDLSPSQRTALACLLNRLGYLGRAESLVEARLLSDGDGVLPQNSVVLPLDTAVPADCELVRVLAPMGQAELSQWLSEAQSRPSPAVQKKTRKKKKDTELPIPANVFDVLLAETPALQSAGWNLPPGAKLLDYTRPADAFEISPVPRSRAESHHPTVARYALVGRVPPRITQALSLSERIHQALVKYSDNHPVFTGVDDAGKPASGHQHAYIFCEPAEKSDAIAFVTVTATKGFDTKAQAGLRRLHRVWGHGGHDVHFVLVGFGTPADFPHSPIFGRSRVWRSLTPFVSTRHPKSFRDGRPKLDTDGWQIGSPQQDVRRLLAAELKPLPARIVLQPEGIVAGGRRHRCIAFQSNRRLGGGKRATGYGFALEVTFSEPVSGPLALGYAAHFGLGLFAPVPS